MQSDKGGEEMIMKNDMVTLNKKEVAELIDNQCKKRLGMSAEEFLEKRKKNELTKSIAVHDIEMLLKLA